MPTRGISARSSSEAVPVQMLVERLGKAWKRPDIAYTPPSFPEAHFLRLDSTKAFSTLGWRPALGFDDAIELTADWYRGYYAAPSSAYALTRRQIDQYRQRLGAAR